jgi:hypothetical protein
MGNVHKTPSFSVGIIIRVLFRQRIHYETLFVTHRGRAMGTGACAYGFGDESLFSAKHKQQLTTDHTMI